MQSENVCNESRIQDAWLKLITEILFSTNIQCKNNNHSTFVRCQKICQNINKKTIFLAYFESLKGNYRSYMRLTLHCFFLTLITVFSYVQCHKTLSVSTIFSFFVFIFTFFFILFSPRHAFYNLQCLIRFDYNLPGDKKYFIVYFKEKLPC